MMRLSPEPLRGSPLDAPLLLAAGSFLIVGLLALASTGAAPSVLRSATTRPATAPHRPVTTTLRPAPSTAAPSTFLQPHPNRAESRLPATPLDQQSGAAASRAMPLPSAPLAAVLLSIAGLATALVRGTPISPWAVAAVDGRVPRRGVLAQTAALLGAPLLTRAEEAGERAPALGAPQTVLITGSNSGIGLDAAVKLARRGDRVLLACRTLAKAEAARDAVLAQAPGVPPSAVLPVACDLASLASVRQCAAAVQALAAPLDVLVLNAGVQFTGVKEPPRTADGFELTVGTNHLGHFLLANLLLPSMSPTGRIVVTASEVHDPESPGGAVGNGATLGDLRGLETPDGRFGMIDGGPYDAEKAYKDSKLCNILFARELQRRLQDEGSDVTVVAFGPGLITRTGFFRNQPPLFVKLFDFATNDLFRVAESVSGGGDCLAYMVETPALPKAIYYNNELDFKSGFGRHAFRPIPVSAEAQDAVKGQRLWELSARLVGLPT